MLSDHSKRVENPAWTSAPEALRSSTLPLVLPLFCRSGTMSIPPPAGDQLSFTPSRELLNPKFESYKLSVPESNGAVQSFPLPGAGFKTRTLPDHARLAFSEVQARVRHNHFSPGKAGELVYIDADLRVVAVELGQVSSQLG